MSSENTHNILYFESYSVRGLYDLMEDWQNHNQKRFLSVSIQQDGSSYCCIALTNPMEVIITDEFFGHKASVNTVGRLHVTTG